MCRPSSTHLLPATLAIIMVAAMLCLAFSARADSDDSSILPSASGAQELGNISGSVFQDITSANLTSDDGNWTIMHPSLEDIERWDALYRRAPAAFLDLQIMHRLQSEPGASLSLLSHLQYTPSERHQGACGNCWAWAGTGVMEVALSVQKNTKDRLSIQYLNSNFYGGNGVDWACCGGWLDDVADFYKGTGKAIPWSNTNARYQDGGKSCSASTGRSGRTPSRFRRRAVRRSRSRSARRPWRPW